MANLLKNPNFGMPPASPTLNIGLYHGGKSAAPDWTTFNNSGPSQTCAYTSTAIIKLSEVDKLVASPDDRDPHKDEPWCYGVHDFLKAPPDTQQVIEVCTNGVDNGIVQVFGGSNKHTRSSVWVFVLRGQVGMGTGDGGHTGINVQSTKTYEWERLQAPSGGAPATEFIVYSTSTEGAWYFVADASVVAV